MSSRNVLNDFDIEIDCPKCRGNAELPYLLTRKQTDKQPQPRSHLTNPTTGNPANYQFSIIFPLLHVTLRLSY
jgi:Zn-finger nucleic acid-binding protein